MAEQQHWSTIRIRLAQPGDAEVIAEMAAALTAYEGKPPSRFTVDHFRRDGFGLGAAFTTLLAEIEQAIVGYALFYPGYDVESASRGVHLADLYVVERVRRQGVGRALLVAVAHACRQAGGQWVTWFVEETNLVGRAFYRSIGAESVSGIPLWIDAQKLEFE